MSSYPSPGHVVAPAGVQNTLSTEMVLVKEVAVKVVVSQYWRNLPCLSSEVDSSNPDSIWDGSNSGRRSLSEMMALFLFLLQVMMAERAGLIVAKQVATVLMVVVVETLEMKNNAGLLDLTSAL